MAKFVPRFEAFTGAVNMELQHSGVFSFCPQKAGELSKTRPLGKILSDSD